MIKKIYQKPSTEKIEAATAEFIAVSVGGNTGITIGEGDPPTEAGAKGNDDGSWGYTGWDE